MSAGHPAVAKMSAIEFLVSQRSNVCYAGTFQGFFSDYALAGGSAVSAEVDSQGSAMDSVPMKESGITCTWLCEIELHSEAE